MNNFSVFIGAVEGANGGPLFMPAKYLNRHGLIAGATGTGKSVSVMGLAESFSRLGVPVLVTDIKGDLSGMGAASTANPAEALTRGVVGWRPEAAPLKLWDVYGDRGDLLSTTIHAMGAPLVARALSLTDTQTGVLEICFAVAEDELRPLNTLADLRAVIAYCVESREEIGRRYGLITPSSVAAIGRAILRVERAGGASFFGAVPFQIAELMQADAIGRGVVNMLDCVRLIREPRLYAAVLLALLDVLSRELPEVGDTDKPRLALIMDEAHLIFADCPPELLATIDQTVRLIRSKGVGVFFASQMPSDVPDGIARQLHLRIQHALRAVTPGDRAQVRAAAESMPAPADFNAADVIGTLRKGSALVSYMNEAGQMTAAQVALMPLPRCRLSPLSDAERAALIGIPEARRPLDLPRREAPRESPEDDAPRPRRPWAMPLAIVIAALTVLILITS